MDKFPQKFPTFSDTHLQRRISALTEMAPTILRSGLIALFVVFSAADFILTQQFSGGLCSGTLLSTQALLPDGCMSLGPLAGSLLGTCSSSLSMHGSVFDESADCGGTPTVTGEPIFPSIVFGCAAEEGVHGSSLTTCEPGTFRPPAGAALTVYSNHACPPVGPPELMVVHPLDQCLPFHDSFSFVYTQGTEGVTVARYPPGCPESSGMVEEVGLLGCSISAGLGATAAAEATTTTREVVIAVPVVGTVRDPFAPTSVMASGSLKVETSGAAIRTVGGVTGLAFVIATVFFTAR